MSRARTWALAAFASAACLQIIWSSRIPVGIYYDDALYLCFARALSHLSIVLPDGRVHTDLLPSFGLLLALPVRLFAPRFELLRYFAVALTWIASFMTWRLARGFLDENWALAAAALFALNTGVMMHCGALMPDIAYTALSLALFAGLGSRRLGWLAAGAAAAALMRPQGVLLILSLALAIAAARGLKRAVVFLASALTLPACWFALCFRFSQTTGDYLGQWHRAMARLAESGGQLGHAALQVVILGGGALNASFLPGFADLALGFLMLGLAAGGVARGLKGPHRPQILAMAAYFVAILCLHQTWFLQGYRYFIPLTSILWIFVLLAVKPWLERRGRLALGALAALLVLAVYQDVAMLPPAGSPPTLWPETMAWIAANTPAQARFQSIHDASVMLFTGRPAVGFTRDLDSREQWLAQCASLHVDYALVNQGTALRTPWFKPDESLSLVYRNPAEDSLLFAIGRSAP